MGSCLPGTPRMHHNPLPKWAIMIAQPRPLIEVFADIPEVRSRRGKRHPLSAILAMACCAMLCGYRSYSAIAEGGRNYGTGIAHALGFTHNTPCAATLHTIFRHVDRDDLEAKLGAWAESVVVSTLPTSSAGGAPRALGGEKPLGPRERRGPAGHLLPAPSPRRGVSLDHAPAGARDTRKLPVQ